MRQPKDSFRTRFAGAMTLGLVSVLIALAPASLAERGDLVIVEMDDHYVYPAQPDFARLPVFHSSKPDLDAFVNEYFRRHLSVDADGVHWDTTGAPGTNGIFTLMEWDAWFLPWIDRGAMGSQRQNQGQVIRDYPLTALLHTAMDKYGYVSGAANFVEPIFLAGGAPPIAGYSWIFPKFQANLVCNPSGKPGWPFDVAGAPTWTAAGDVQITEPPVGDPLLFGTLVVDIIGPQPEIVSPSILCQTLQMPLLEVDVELIPPMGETLDPSLIDDLEIYWTTDAPGEGTFSSSRSTTTDFAAAPPADFPALFSPHVKTFSGRYPLYFPMHLHPEWGRSTTRQITGLKLALPNPDAEGYEMRINFIRTSYDGRINVSNTTLIDATHRFVLWMGADLQDRQGRDFLALMMPDLRRAMLFLNEHLRGKQDQLLNLGWLVGHDGIGNQVGHGVAGSSWDILPSGLYDLETSARYYAALLAMAELEEIAADRNLVVPPVTVVGPDNQSTLTWGETPTSLRALATQVKARIESAFWNPQTLRFDRNLDANENAIRDLGALHFNLLALAMGIGTDTQRDHILSWLDGRVIPGDANDIYRWRFAPRFTTRPNSDYYYWQWARQTKVPGFGEQLVNGGAIPATSFFDLTTRSATGDQAQIDRAFNRVLELESWFLDVKNAGGQGKEFYRVYYTDPSLGVLQGDGAAGSLALDVETGARASMGTTFMPHAFLGLETEVLGTLRVAPKIPSQLDWIGVDNVYFQGNHVDIEAGRDPVERAVYAQVSGSLGQAAGLSLEIVLREVPSLFEVRVDGVPTTTFVYDPIAGTVTVDLPLGAVDVRVVDLGPLSPPYEVDFSQGLQGWQAFGVFPPQVTSQGIEFSVHPSFSPLLNSPAIDLDGSAYGTVKVRLRLTPPSFVSESVADGHLYFFLPGQTAASPTRRVGFQV
ncbi:MAG: hypothetical protein AAF657_23530, partial [Acidobacteriota bacterium]